MLRRREPDCEAGCLLTEIYREHAAGAYRYAYHLTRSREDSDDIVQVVFLALHQALLRGETIVSPGAFLATAVKRRVINLAARRRAEPDSAGVEGTAAPSGGMDAAAELARIQALLYTLPEAQHQAFVLRHWGGLSNREIAGVLAKTEPAVESLLVRARAALMAAAAPDRECAEVCARLAQDRPKPSADAGHISSCRSCRTAEQRLARAAEIAAAAALLPNLHVAHALAAAVPGFSAGAAVGASGVGASGGAVATAAGSKAGTAVLLAKTGAALVAVTAVTAVGIHAHRWTRAAHPTPPAHVAGSPTRRSASTMATRGPATVAATQSPQTGARGGTDTTRPARHETADAKDGRDGSSAGATSTTGGDSHPGSGGSSGGSGDGNAGGRDTGTASGSDGSGSDGGGTDSSSGQGGDGGDSGGSSDTSGSGQGESGSSGS